MNRPHSGSFEGIRCCGAAREGRPTAKLEDVEGLSLERFREGLVVRRLALIEEGLGAGSPVDAGQGDGASHEVTSKPFDAEGVDRPDGGRRIHGEAAVAERSEKLNAFVGEKSFALEHAKDFVSPQLFGSVDIEVGWGCPLS